MNKHHQKKEKKNESKPVIDWQEQVCHFVLTEFDKGQSFTSDVNDLYDDIYSMIRGERPQKDYDWQSNVVLNKAFQIVWTALPYILQKIFGADPIIGVDSFNKQGAWEREKILNFWATMQPATDSQHRDYFLVMVMWVLRALLNGVGINKKGWHQVMKSKTITTKVRIPTSQEMAETGEETGEIGEEEKEVSRTVSFPAEDWPINMIVNNRDIVCDWMLQPGQSIRQGRFVTHREVFDLDYLYSSEIDYVNLDMVEKSAALANTSKASDDSKNKSKDGQQDPPSSDIYAEVELFERQGLLLVKKSEDTTFNREGLVPCFDKSEIGEEGYSYEQMIVTVAKAGESGKPVLIRFEKNPYGEKTYVDMHIFFDAERWQSVGQIEPVKDLISAQNDHLNAMFDEIWQNILPPVIVNKYALWDWDTMIYAPQQRWLVGGPPNDAIAFPQPRQIVGDAWQKHALLETEQQLTSAITAPMQGVGREKAATTNVLNAQMSAGKMDFIVKMIEKTALIPDAQMNIRFAKKFAHPLTFQMILGKPFKFQDYDEIYKFIPAASSVKLEHQKENEIMQDVQVMGILSGIQNPNVPKILNKFIQNILRNRNMPDEAASLDEDFYEPNTAAGNMQMLQRQFAPGAESNQNGVQMSGTERNVRQKTTQPRGMMGYGR